jgi:hypothetical protein
MNADFIRVIPTLQEARENFYIHLNGMHAEKNAALKAKQRVMFLKNTIMAHI